MMIKQLSALLLSMLLAVPMMSPVTVSAGTLSTQPLSLKGGVPPTVMFALSVEFPTAITAAYQDSSSYSSTSQYLGYFDNGKCYGYDVGNAWFFPTSLTANRTCTSGWSGNFLNWASMAGLDEYRYAMTGGNRYRDTAVLTVLERSYQSNQGSAGSNFPDKTYTDTTGTATPYAAGTTLTIKNWNQGINMTIAQGANNSDTLLCNSPSLVGSAFNCSLTRLAAGEVGACSTWGGTGALATPYGCTTFGAFNGLTPSSATNGTIAAASKDAVSSHATCTPGFDVSNNFTCSPLQLTNTHTGTCSTWDPTGDGSAAHPFRCLRFGTFSGGENVAESGAGIASAQVLTYYGAQTSTTYSACSVTSASAGSPPVTTVTTSCNASPAPNATCTSYSGNGGTTPYTCTSFGLSGGAQFVSAAVNGSSTTTVSTKKYYTSYKIAYKPQLTGSIWYVSDYPVAATNIYYYYANYSATFGTTPTTFAVRVKVCDQTVGLESNCQQIGTSYKPTGVVQDNGSTMRFGVTSYFNANDIDNAVLRSKAKFVAPTQFAGAGTSSINPYMEWSAADGTLFTNPANCADGTTVGLPVNCTADTATTNSYVGVTGNSGVINYINKFGSNSRSYKTYDNTGKLYYETLKYLRGLTATPDFYNGAKVSNADGFPVISNWDNPLTTGWSCQKNYIVAMGDTHTWCDKRLPGGNYGTTGSGTCNAYTDGNAHGHVQDTGSLPGDSVVNTATSTNQVGSWEGLAGLSTTMTGAGGASFGMAGLASWAASHDIVTGSATASSKKTVRSYVIDVEEAKDCGYQSQYWLTSKYGVPEAYDNVGNWIGTNTDWKTTQAIGAGSCSSRPPPTYNNATGGTFEWPKQLLRANDPAGMISSVRSAIAQIAALTGDEAALAQSSGTLDAGTGAYTYRAAYNTGGWKGDVSALAIDTSGNFAATPAWSASSKLPAPAVRNIISWNPVTHTAFLFANSGGTLPTGLSVAEAAFLNADDAGNVDGLGVDRINYLRGDQSKEVYVPGTTTLNPNPNNGWRARTSMVAGGGILGDFINSNPLFLGPPNIGYSFAGYKAFATAKANRTPILFVGGNDGMLHAFDASYTIDVSGMPVVTANSGKEVMGYIPSVVYSKLSKLMNPNYSHRYFVDGSPVGGDICADVCAGASDWKSIVVGTTGAGGQGVFAIDATTASFSASSIMWEFSDVDDADLGYTFSKPIIRKLNDGKWYVIFGNGYNNTDSDGNSSAAGRAVLYLLRASGPSGASGWTLNTDYFKIELISPSEPAGLATRLVNPNGLSAVSAIDITGDDVSDYLYAGDRNGNLWKIDVTSNLPQSWKSSFLTGTTPLPLFSAVDALGNRQQITTGVEVVAHPTSGVLVTFGTGSWIDNQDAIGPFSTTESFYGIWDKMDGTQVTRTNLQKQAVIAHIKLDASGMAIGTCSAGETDCYAVLSNCSVNYTTNSVASNLNDPLCPATVAHGNAQDQQLGWVTDMPAMGERTRSSMPLANGSNIKFQSLTPTSDPCTGNTVGMEYQLSALTGGMPSLPVYVTGPGSSGINTLNNSYFPTLGGGATVGVVVSGKTVGGGASDNPVQFNARPPSSVVTPPAGMPQPPSGPCTGAACSGYIPGWGFLMNLNGATAANSRYIYSCHPPEFGNGAPICTWEYKRGQFGRLNWKQINR